ncbi:MAG TPA: tyrosine-type recombinase/integrase [Candidatus Eremiobacteraceae bacterium]|nr:tyrosine-type recombinase/integrase [Candidatus Eremiobacteraceae bacterium]
MYKNSNGTMWLGQFSEYVLNGQGIEERKIRTLQLCPTTSTKRDAMRVLQPHLDRVNANIGSSTRESKSMTLEAFLGVWERDYASLCKPSTRAGLKCHAKQLKDAFGTKDMRKIGAGDLQGLISKMNADGLDPKTIRNLWTSVSLIWQAALAQKFVDATLPKPKLPKRLKKKKKFFDLAEVGKLIATVEGEDRLFFWLAAETGLRAGELAGLRLSDIVGDRLTVAQSVWHGNAQEPKTENSKRSLALSPQLVALLWEQIVKQRAKAHEFLFTTASGKPWCLDNYRARTLKPLLAKLEIAPKGFHALRHFNSSLLDHLGVPLKVREERLGHSLTESITQVVYTHTFSAIGDTEAATKAGAAIAEEVAKAVSFAGLTTTNEKGSQSRELEAYVA